MAMGISGNTIANNRFRTSGLKSLARSLDLYADTLPSGEFIYSNFDRPVVVRIANNWVTHIGYRIFSSEMREAGNTPILDFLERYFLQLHHPSDRTPSQMLRDNRFVFKKGKMSDVYKIKNDDGFSIVNSEGRYLVTWYRNDEPYLEVSFPIEYELISGENKIEAENNYEHYLTEYKFISEQQSNDSIEKSLSPTAQLPYYVMKGGSYINEKLCSDQFYIKTNDEYDLLSDVLHPIESLANMMLNTKAEGDYTLNITQVLYGYTQKKYSTSLKDWVGYCQNVGCNLYYGVEEVDDSLISAIVVASNDALGYDHLMFVKMPFQIIEGRSGEIEARLETFIPRHNICNLFEKYRDKIRKL